MLTQAVLQAPLFGTRWRWNATRALALLRCSGRQARCRRRSSACAPTICSAAVFPAQVGCQDNHGGAEIELPDHPLVNETIDDCLHEAMDIDGLAACSRRIERGEIDWSRATRPSRRRMSHEILNAKPYTFLDDAPLEERRTRAVSLRRGLPVDVARELGALDPEAIAEVRARGLAGVRDADELHDALCLLGVLPEDDAGPELVPLLEELAAARRATRARVGAGEARRTVWVAAERLGVCRSAYGGLELATEIASPPGSPEPRPRRGRGLPGARPARIDGPVDGGRGRRAPGPTAQRRGHRLRCPRGRWDDLARPVPRRGGRERVV